MFLQELCPLGICFWFCVIFLSYNSSFFIYNSVFDFVNFKMVCFTCLHFIFYDLLILLTALLTRLMLIW